VPAQFPVGTLLAIEEGTTLSGASQILKERSVIRSPFLFKVLVIILAGVAFFISRDISMLVTAFTALAAVLVAAAVFDTMSATKLIAALAAASAIFLVTSVVALVVVFDTTSSTLVMVIVVALAVLVVALAALSANEFHPRTHVGVLLIEHIVWTTAIGFAVYLDATLYGGIAFVLAVALPLVLLWYEARGERTCVAVEV